MLSENIIADLIRFDECAKCFQKENRDKLIALLDFSLPFLCLNSYFFVYPYQERSTKAFLLLCGRLFYPLEDEWTMVFELSLIRSAFAPGGCFFVCFRFAPRDLNNLNGELRTGSCAITAECTF